MASSRTTFEKLQRDRAKAAKKALKQQKRLERRTTEDETPEPVESAASLIPDKKSLGPAELLATVEKLHASYAKEEISFEEFEEAKAELMAMIQVD